MNPFQNLVSKKQQCHDHISITYEKKDMIRVTSVGLFSTSYIQKYSLPRKRLPMKAQNIQGTRNYNQQDQNNEDN